MQHDRELSTRIAEIKVPLLSPDELRQIVRKGGKCLNVTFAEGLEDELVRYSNNLAAVCHHLCYNVCYFEKIEQTQRTRRYLTNDQLQNSIESYVKQNTDTFAKILDSVTKQKKGRYENVRMILKACIELEEPFAQHQILSKIRQKAQDYPASNLTAYLRPLATTAQCEIFRFDHNAKKYSFSNPFFKAFVMMVFSSEKNKGKKVLARRQMLLTDFPEYYSVYINKLRSIMEEYNYMRDKFEREMKTQ